MHGNVWNDFYGRGVGCQAPVRLSDDGHLTDHQTGWSIFSCTLIACNKTCLSLEIGLWMGKDWVSSPKPDPVWERNREIMIPCSRIFILLWFWTLSKTGPQILAECFEHYAMLRHVLYTLFNPRNILPLSEQYLKASFELSHPVTTVLGLDGVGVDQIVQEFSRSS